MAAPTNSGESDMATEELYSDLSPLLSPRWSQLCLTPSPPRSFLPSSSSMVIYQGSNQSMDDPPQNQEHEDIVDPALYLAGDSAFLQQQQQLRQNWGEASDWRPREGIMRMNMLELQSKNQGFEESNMGFERIRGDESNKGFEESNMGFSPSSSPTNFPLCRPMPSDFFVSSEQENISLPLSCQHLLEDKSGALHVINQEELDHISQPLFNGFEFFSYIDNKFGDLDVVPKDVESLVGNLLEQRDYDEKEVTLRRINCLEQKDEDNVDQPVFEMVSVLEQLIQNRGGKLNVILGGGVFTVDGVKLRDCQGPPSTPETLLICRAMVSIRVWLGHGGQWTAEIRCIYNSLSTGIFTTVEDAMSAYELVLRWSGRVDLTGFPGLFENENRSKLPLLLPPPAQELNLVEDFGLVCCNATGNDEIEAVGTGSEGTWDCVMADQGKRKSMEKNQGGETRNKKTKRVRIVIPPEDTLQTKGMGLEVAANHFEALAATVGTNSVVVKEIPQPQFSLTDQQDNLDEDFGKDEVEAVGMVGERTGEGKMDEGQLNSGYLGKGKRKEETSGGERRNKKTNGVKIAISLDDILQAQGMLLEDAAKKFKVSRSTLKRVCRKYGILSWPPSKGNEHISQSRPKKSPAVVDQEEVQQLNCDIPPSDQASAANVDTNSVVLKARWVDDIIVKIRLPKPWKMAELEQQVKKRLKLESGTYYIRYKDKENELITILCDEDLQEYISSSRPLDTSSIEVFLVPK